MKTIPLFKVNMSEKVSKKLKKVLTSGFIGQGKQVEKFEKKLRKLWNTDNILTVNSGTSALSLAYHLIGLKDGDEVISTPVTCFATISPLANLKVKIVWADVDPLTGLIDTNDVKRKVTKDTKAIIVVDWSGMPVDYDELRKNNIPIIQDAAHSFLTKYNHQHISNTGGDYVAFSFQEIKSLTTGGGGALKVPENQFKRAKLLRWFGLDRESGQSFRCAQNIKEAGFKMHLIDINAVIGICNMNKAIVSTELGKMNAKYYCENIKNDKITIIPYDNRSSYWLYTIIVKEDKYKLVEYLKENGIASSDVHRRCDKHDVVKEFSDNKLFGVDYFDEKHLCIPCGFWLKNKDVKQIVNLINKW